VASAAVVDNTASARPIVLIEMFMVSSPNQATWLPIMFAHDAIVS
jgi:hypothetical protein